MTSSWQFNFGNDHVMRITPHPLVSRLAPLLAEVEYRPGWKLLVHERQPGAAFTMFDNAVAEVRALTTDSTGEFAPEILINHFLPLPPSGHCRFAEVLSDDELLEWFFNHVVMKVERHEAREWFRYRGTLHRDPHRDGFSHLYE